MRQDAPSAEAVPVVESLREVVFPEGDVVAAEFGPDGLYVLLAKPSLNVSPLISQCAPHACAGILGLVILWLMLRGVGALRRRHRRGVPHCARCGYELGGLGSRDDRGRWSFAPEFRCPECGMLAAKRRPIIGRSALRRIRTPLIATAVFATLSLWLWWPVLFGPGARQLPFDAHFAALRRVLDRMHLSWVDERVWYDVSSVVLIKDLAASTHTIVLEKGPAIVYLSFFVSPHGGSFFVWDTIRGRMRRYDGKTGRLLGAIDVPWSTRWFEPMSVIDVSDGSAFAYVEWNKPIAERCGVLEWDLNTNETRVLVDLPYIRDSRPSMTNGIRRLFVRVPGREPAVFLAYLDSLDRESAHFELHPRAALSDSEPKAIENLQHPAIGGLYDQRRTWVSPTRRLYARGIDAAVSMIGIESGELEAEIAKVPNALNEPNDYPFWIRRDEKIAACAMPGEPRKIGVYRLTDGELVSILSSPTDLFPTQVRISPDGRFVLVTTFDGRKGPSNCFASQAVVIWRLPDDVLQSIDGG